MRPTTRLCHARLAGLACVAFVAAVGCAEGESFADAGPEAGSPFSCGDTCDGPPPPPPLMLEMAPPPPPPQDMYVPPPPPDMSTTIDPNADCDPGTRLGPCALCDIDGRPVMPEEDPTCPDLTCPDGEAYARELDGEESVCYRVVREAPGGDCLALGACHTSVDTYCGEPTREEVARVLEGTCSGMEGCAGTTPPDVSGRLGEPCNGTGLCNVEGECSVPDICANAQLFNRSQICDSDPTPGQAYCEFRVEQGGDLSCADFCASFGRTCIQAWNDGNGGLCVRAENIGCNQDYSSFICRCGE